MSNRTFQKVGGARVGRSVFDLSYEKKFTCDMGQLIPIMCDEVVPGDIMSIGNETVIRMQPMIAPLLHEVNVFTHYFFVPYRLIWDDWEEFITGGTDGNDTTALPDVSDHFTSGNTVKNSLWDYFGFPIGADPTKLGVGVVPFPWYSYNLIYDEYYRDQTLQTETTNYANGIKKRDWEKDYFTSALPWQQRGTAPALPISGTTSAVWTSDSFQDTAPASSAGFNTTPSNPDMYTGSSIASANALGFMNDNTVDISLSETFDIADLRLAFQIQRWMERNARAGVRYTEFLRAHFSVAPRDDRLDRPEYLGGSKAPVIFSEVLQTSASDITGGATPQGNLAGHGIAVSKKFITKYRVKEFGIIMGLMSIMPKPAYQQGINRQWIKESKYDFFFPEFQNLSEQQIYNLEIYNSDNAAINSDTFGFQGRYDEMRYKPNLVVGSMRDTFNYWHLGRDFDSLPTLGNTFLQCDVDNDDLKRIFASESEDGMIVNTANIIKAVRPLPIMSNPGLIDHV